jgi:hypothetical protein
MTDRGDLAGLSLYHLEDSWVFDVVARPGTLTVTMNVVLLPDHPEHRPPSPGEQYCYRRGELLFRGVTSLRWDRQGLPPARDVTGQIDYGGVDWLSYVDGAYHLSGDFGDIVVAASSVRIDLGPQPPP